MHLISHLFYGKYEPVNIFEPVKQTQRSSCGAVIKLNKIVSNNCSLQYSYTICAAKYLLVCVLR